jgi:catechol 2,3-dioxygenase-like lactoylglutathione lyase family enzyme
VVGHLLEVPVTRHDRWPEEPADDAPLLVTGLHHVRLPVTDPERSRDWYVQVGGFVPVLDYEQEHGVVGVVCRHPSGLVIGLHQDPDRAAALSGFAVLSLAVATPEDLERWVGRLDRSSIAHGPIEQGHLGPYLEVPDPDGIVVRFHGGPLPYVEEA